MYSFNIKIAGVVVGINCNYIDTMDLCNDYIVNDDIDFSVEIDNKDIEFEKEKSIKEAILEGIPVYKYEDGYLETLAVYRKIVTKMLDYNVCLFHGAGICLNDEAFLFTAKSGTGKTTHINLWLEKYKDAFVVNGDKPLLKIDDNKIYLCGTPWSGKEGLNKNCIKPLKAICILERDKANHIERIDYKSAFNHIYPQIYKPSDVTYMRKTLDLLGTIGKSIPIYKLGCNMDIEAAEVSYNGMK